MDASRDDVARTVDALLAAGRDDDALELLGGLSASWQDAGRVDDGRRLTERTLAAAVAATDAPRGRARRDPGDELSPRIAEASRTAVGEDRAAQLAHAASSSPADVLAAARAVIDADGRQTASDRGGEAPCYAHLFDDD